MATAGERYEELTGNIWSYAHRGDMIGLKAALTRGVSPNATNTVGWTPTHAAAAGGHCKSIRLLVKNGADIEIVDRGGNSPAHQAAKNGHPNALELLGELGADITKVRLSHAKGKAVRCLLIGSYRKAGIPNRDEEEEAVGYARKQTKSTAFWGPRRTPISTKIKKKIIKEKRLKKKEKNVMATQDAAANDAKEMPDAAPDASVLRTKPSYIDTVRQIKREKKQRRHQKQGRQQQLGTKEVEDLIKTGGVVSSSSAIHDVSEEEADVKVSCFAALSLCDSEDADD